MTLLKVINVLNQGIAVLSKKRNSNTIEPRKTITTSRGYNLPNPKYSVDGCFQIINDKHKRWRNAPFADRKRWQKNQIVATQVLLTILILTLLLVGNSCFQDIDLS